ncbi:MAG: F0F1 ATP synthase subunit epsilon [Chthoniobacterales bacterium]
MATLTLEIVTPESLAYSEPVDSVVIPGADGELGILPMHVPLMTELNPGELRISKSGQETSMAIGYGFAEVVSDRVVVLTDTAINEVDIDESAAEDAITRAKKALEDKNLATEDMQVIEAALQRSLAQLKVKRRKRNHS